MTVSLLNCNTKIMKSFKLTIAKILTTFVILLLLVIIFFTFIASYISNFLSFNLDLFIVVICIIASYYISSLLFSYKKNHQKIFIVIITLLISLSSFFILTLLVNFFTLCISDLRLPCLENEKCPPPPPCTPTIQITILSDLCIIIPLIVLVIGVIFFIKENKRKLVK